MEDDEIRDRKNESNYNCPTCSDTGRYGPMDRAFSGIVHSEKDCPWGCKPLWSSDAIRPPSNRSITQ